MINCNECSHVSITEEQQQTDKYKDHICKLHYVKVRHRASSPKEFHSYIHPCARCKGLDFNQR